MRKDDSGITGIFEIFFSNARSSKKFSLLQGKMIIQMT